MLEVGNGEFNPSSEVDTDALNRARTHFSLWVIMKAPILLGNDFTVMTNATLDILRNTEALSIHQDSLGVQVCVSHSLIWRLES
jgi:alpha-galactosidase